MKKTVALLIFAAFLVAPLYIMSDTPVSRTFGEPIGPESPVLKIEPDVVANLGPIKTGGAHGVLLCWMEAAWRGQRPILFAIEGSSLEPAIVRKQVSHEHACVEIHASIATYRSSRKGRKSRKELKFEPLPDPAFINIFVKGGGPVEFLAEPDGSLRTWLITQTTFGDNRYGMLKSLISRASQYKPVSPWAGFALFAAWLPLMLFTGYRIIFHPPEEDNEEMNEN